MHPIVFRSITDTHNYGGFYADVIPRTLGNAVYLEIFIMFMLYQVGFCSYIDACTDDYKTIMKQLNDCTHDESNALQLSDYSIKCCLKEAIDLHTEMLK